MSPEETACLQHQPVPPRPNTRTDQRPKNYSSYTFNDLLCHRAKTSKKLDPAFRMSSQRKSFHQKKDYLHLNLMRKHQNYTPQLILEQTHQKNKSDEHSSQANFFIRTRRRRGVPSARTDILTITDKETRPSTSQNSQNSEKLAYFNDQCSGVEVLRSYRIMSHIGKGAFSVVSLAIGKKDTNNYAIKTYQKIEALDWNRLACIKREIRHLRKLRHERVIRLVDVVKERKKIYLVLQNGGKHSLSGLLRKEKVLSQQKCKRYFRQVLEGISYCHQSGVCHRDLKPENILLDEEGKIKIIDFGFSAHSKIMLNVFCGTPAYMAPELVKKQPYNGAKADIWAIGVMLYLTMVGTLPFRASNQQQLNRLIVVGKYRYRDQASVPLGARKLIIKMLQVNPDARPTARELLQDNWLH